MASVLSRRASASRTSTSRSPLAFSMKANNAALVKTMVTRTITRTVPRRPRRACSRTLRSPGCAHAIAGRECGRCSHRDSEQGQALSHLRQADDGFLGQFPMAKRQAESLGCIVSVLQSARPAQGPFRFPILRIRVIVVIRHRCHPRGDASSPAVHPQRSAFPVASATGAATPPHPAPPASR
jgi:hypothetical protein